jgi:hypothetical protein
VFASLLRNHRIAAGLLHPESVPVHVHVHAGSTGHDLLRLLSVVVTSHSSAFLQLRCPCRERHIALVAGNTREVHLRALMLTTVWLFGGVCHGGAGANLERRTNLQAGG